MFGSCECGYEDCGICGPHIEAAKARRSKPKKPRGPFWTTREGVQMAIRDMESSHIHNCMKHLERRKLQVEEEYAMLPEPYGDHAQDAFCREIETLMETDIRDVFPIYVKFEKELDRRALKAEKKSLKTKKPRS